MRERPPLSQRRRVLFLLPHVPSRNAAAGGSRCTANLVAGLSKRHDIAVLCLRGSNDVPADEALRAMCAVFETVDMPARRGPRRAHRAWAEISALGRRPRWALKLDVPSYRARLRSLMLEWRPDVVQIEYHVMGQYASALDGHAVPRIMTQYEPGVTAARDAQRAARGLKRVPAALQVAAWERYERRVMQQVDAIVAFTERDRRTLAPLAGGVPIVTIPPGVDLPEQPLNPAGAVPPSILFVGGFVHPPNVDAARRLIQSIFPRVRHNRPDAHLVVVGPRPGKEIRASSGDGVTVTGAVESTVPFLDAASVVVAPLRQGGGMRVKVMEALAAGKAIVASPLAAEGLAVTNGEQILIADGDEEFAGAIVRLLDDTDFRVGMATRARCWARQNLGWQRSVAAYEILHTQLCAGALDEPAASGWGT